MKCCIIPSLHYFVFHSINQKCLKKISNKRIGHAVRVPSHSLQKQQQKSACVYDKALSPDRDKKWGTVIHLVTTSGYDSIWTSDKLCTCCISTVNALNNWVNIPHHSLRYQSYETLNCLSETARSYHWCFVPAL